jgi:hypothetical protein
MTELTGDQGLQANTGDLGGEGGTGNGGAEFLATLPEGVRDNEVFQGIESLEGLTQSYLDLHGKAAAMPQVPADADGYEALAPEGVKLDETRVNEFKAEAHKLGLTQEQFIGLVNYDIERSRAATDAHSKARNDALETAVTALKAEWGDKYEENANIAENALNKLTTPAFRELLVSSGLNDNPLVVHTFHNLGIVLSEDQFVSAERKAAGGRPKSEDGKSMLKFKDMD